MNIITISRNNPEIDAIKNAAAIIKNGGVVVYPSDTSYGLACDPTNPEALRKLCKIKSRDLGKPVSYNFGSIEGIGKFCELTSEQINILRDNLPGPFTFLLTPKPGIFEAGEKIGVRLPDSPVVSALSLALGGPFTATSANLAGEPACYSPEAIIKTFVGAPVQPDLLLDAGPLPPIPASTVVDLTVTPPQTIRLGARTPILK
ncbi:MAG: L-threonylcarbamoyladenylate synthase [bacterium]